MKQISNLISFDYTKSSNLSNFQFKLLHRKIPTNKFLYTIKVKKKPQSLHFLYNNIKTLLHMLWVCHIVQHFWNSLERWFQSKYFFT